MMLLKEVINELEKIEEARTHLQLSWGDHPVELYMALAHVESNGVNVQDDDSYVGVLQIGDAYYQDAYEWLERHHPDLLQGWPEPGRGARLFLRGDGIEPYIVAMAYFERYASFHEYNPYRMAGMHKGGIGSAKQVKRKVQQGLSVFEAMRWTSTHWRYAEGHRREGQLIVPRLYLYVTGRDARTGAAIEQRFAQAYDAYTAHVEHLFGDVLDNGVC